MTALFAAFDRHGIACAAPAPVNSGCAEAPAAPTLSATAGVVLGHARLERERRAPSSYWVLRSEGHAGCDFGKAKIAEVTGTTFTDTEVAPGRSYAYNVVAQGASPACYSAVSNCVAGHADGLHRPRLLRGLQPVVAGGGAGQQRHLHLHGHLGQRLQLRGRPGLRRPARRRGLQLRPAGGDAGAQRLGGQHAHGERGRHHARRHHAVRSRAPAVR